MKESEHLVYITVQTQLLGSSQTCDRQAWVWRPQSEPYALVILSVAWPYLSSIHFLFGKLLTYLLLGKDLQISAGRLFLWYMGAHSARSARRLMTLEAAPYQEWSGNW